MGATTVLFSLISFLSTSGSVSRLSQSTTCGRRRRTQYWDTNMHAHAHAKCHLLPLYNSLRHGQVVQSGVLLGLTAPSSPASLRSPQFETRPPNRLHLYLREAVRSVRRTLFTAKTIHPCLSIMSSKWRSLPGQSAISLSSCISYC